MVLEFDTFWFLDFVVVNSNLFFLNLDVSFGRAIIGAKDGLIRIHNPSGMCWLKHFSITPCNIMRLLFLFFLCIFYFSLLVADWAQACFQWMELQKSVRSSCRGLWSIICQAGKPVDIVPTIIDSYIIFLSFLLCNYLVALLDRR